MSQIMVAPKKPADHAAKKVTPAPDKPFMYTAAGGGKVKLAAPSSVLTVGFARRVRHLDLTSQFFEMLEALADEATLAVIDEMKRDEFTDFQLAFYAHAGIELGE